MHAVLLNKESRSEALPLMNKNVNESGEECSQRVKRVSQEIRLHRVGNFGAPIERTLHAERPNSPLTSSLRMWSFLDTQDTIHGKMQQKSKLSRTVIAMTIMAILSKTRAIAVGLVCKESFCTLESFMSKPRWRNDCHDSSVNYCDKKRENAEMTTSAL